MFAILTETGLYALRHPRVGLRLDVFFVDEHKGKALVCQRQ